MPKLLNQKGITPITLAIIAGVVVATLVLVSKGGINFRGKNTNSFQPSAALNELNCFQMMIDVTKANSGELEWGKKLSDVTTYPTEKGSITKKEGDYCQTQRVQKDGTMNPVETVRVTYFQDASETENKLRESKTKEDSSFKVSSEDETFYIGSAARTNNDNFAFNYAKGVKNIGNCLFEYKYSMDRLFDQSFDPEGKFIKAAEISAKNILEGINDNESIITFCKGISTAPKGNNSSSNSNGQTSNGLDCLATLSEAAEPSSAWKTLGKIASEKQKITQTTKDYCLLKHQSHISDYGSGMGQVEDPNVLWTVKVTYFKNSDEGSKYAENLEKSEKNTFQATPSLFGYSGQTTDLSGPNYLKNIVLLDHCLVEQSVENNLLPLINGNGVFKWDKSKVETHMGMMKGWVDGLLYNLQNNQKFNNFCN